MPHSREGTLVLLEGLVDQHMSLELVLAVERRLAHGAFVGLLTCRDRARDSPR
jgi:hypothetical protein